MITGIVGLPGQGKTLWATKQIHKSIDDGEIVFSNVHVNDNRLWFYYEDFKLLTRVQQALIVLDEAQVYMNARKWASFPEEFQAFSQQHRHQGVDIFALTQNLNRVDVTFRELVQELWEVRQRFMWRTGFLFGWFQMEMLAEPPHNFIPTGETKSFFAFDDDFKYYDTHSRAPDPLYPILTACKMCGVEHQLIGWRDTPPPALVDGAPLPRVLDATGTLGLLGDGLEASMEGWRTVVDFGARWLSWAAWASLWERARDSRASETPPPNGRQGWSGWGAWEKVKSEFKGE